MKAAILFPIVVFAALGVGIAQNDPPGRVARLNFISGAVSFDPGGVENAWVDAAINRPLTTGDQLWTDEGGRAEMELGSAALRLNSRTAFEFLNLNDNNTQIRLAEGSLTARIRELGENESFEIDTPNLAFTLLRPGEYRIDANPEATIVTVRGGEGEVTSNNQAFTVRPQQQARVTGGETVTYDLVNAPPPDSWDRWCINRDRRAEASVSARYVPREMIGYEDLDEYGAWREMPGYGYVWAPRTVVVGWAPYRYGHWVWINPWGWTWVDDAPWGFAPFHYGRWAYAGGGWVWVPGPRVVRPVYAPALVAWVGGSHFNLSVSFGAAAGVAWFPLGPREVYVPAYRASPAYVNRVNITNTTITNVNITNINVTNVRYVNREAPGAITAVPQSALATSEPVARAAVAVNARQIASAPVAMTAPVVPRRESVLGHAEARPAAAPPAAIVNRAVVARNTPPPRPIPFAERRQALAANPGHPLDPQTMARLRATQPAAQPHPLVHQAAIARGAAPERRFEPQARPNVQNEPRQFGRPAQPYEMQRPMPPRPMPANEAARPRGAAPQVERANPHAEAKGERPRAQNKETKRTEEKRREEERRP